MSYTILIMRTQATDRRPLTLRVPRWLLWLMLAVAVLLPAAGFLLAAGVLAPKWLQLNVNSMRYQVEQAEKIKEDHQQIVAEIAELRTQLDNERRLRAEAETKATMAETARSEATTKFTNLELDLVALKRSVAVYEQLLKPKLERELLQCVDLQADSGDGKVRYSVNFARITKTAKLPEGLSARVRIVAGDNALAMETNGASNRVINHPLNNNSLSLRNELELALPEGTTRLIDVKVLDSKQNPVGYCWKTF